MTTEAPVSVTGLLQKGEEDFDVTIKAMPIKTLMEVISGLQKEMAREQENFNSLSGELQSRKEKNSRQSKQISKDMMTSQQRLTMLMNRSMKCFAQQNAAVNKGTQLKRRNSAKGLQPVMAPADKLSATNIHRSRSMHAVNQPAPSAAADSNGGLTLKPSLSILSPKGKSSLSTGVNGGDKDKNHTPIIMKPPSGRGALTRNSLSNASKVQPSGSSSLTKATTNGMGIDNGKDDGGDDGNVQSSSSTTESTGGIYVKRKQQQQQQPTQKVLTTTNFSPSPSIPASQINIASSSTSPNAVASTTAIATLPPKTPLSSSAQNLSSLSSSSSSSSPSSSNPRGIQILQTKHRLPPSSSSPSSSNSSNFLSSPLLMTQSRPGLSKSQIIGQSGAKSYLSTSPSFSSSSSSSSAAASGESSSTNPADEFRGLPSVKMLAQSFGSSTALNTVTNNSNTPHSSFTSGRVLSPGSRGVSRSSSSVCFGQSKNPHVSSFNRIFLSKKTNSIQGENPTSSNNNAHVINGGTKISSQQQQQQENNIHSNSLEKLDQRARSNSQNSEMPKPAASTNGGGVSSELEMARARLKSNRNSKEVLDPPEGISTCSSESAPSSNPASVNAATSNATTSVPAASTAANTAPKTNGIPTQTPAISTQQQKSQNDNINITKANSKPQEMSTATAAITTAAATNASLVRPGAYVKKSGIQGVNRSSAPLKISTTSSSSSSSTSSNNIVKSSATLSLAPSDMRRSKSREELQSVSAAAGQRQQRMPDREGLLKQIQARRVDPEGGKDSSGGGGGSNVQSMAKLSRSMPSLLAADNFWKTPPPPTSTSTTGSCQSESIFNPPTYGSGTREDPIKSSIPVELTQTTKPANTHYNDNDDEGGDDDDAVNSTKPRMNLRDWDPSTVISDLYQVKLMDEVVEDISHQYVSMEGLMEKLPMNKKKATLLKTWKRRFFKAQDGYLYYYESGNRDKPSETIQLMGGAIHDLGNRILGIDDGRGRYLMVRCPTDKEYGQWKVALESQTADNTKATYVIPMLTSPKNAAKNVVVIDLGSSAIRAGILGEKASLPQLFFPSLVGVDKETGKVKAVGQDVIKPDIRHQCDVIHPIRPSNKVDQFNIEIQLLSPIFSKVFQELGVKAEDYMVMLSTPQNLGDAIKKGLMDVLVGEMKVKAVCMVQQSLLALYSYNATSGVIVDIGHRIEILPIFDGFVIEGGVARCPYGGQKVQEALTTALLANNYKLVSPTEQWLVRYVMEKSCYVATVYSQEEEWCRDNPHTIKTDVNLHRLKLPQTAYQSVSHDLSRFKSPEGFFNVDLWEMDYPTLQKLVHQAIQTCPMDNRRHMWRAVFLSGGVTMLPGFAERLEAELTKLAPPGVPVEVHASPQRYHSAYIGACSVALMPQFAGMAISREEWKSSGVKTFRKWKTS